MILLPNVVYAAHPQSAGLLSEPVDTKVSAHVYVGSHASWDVGFVNDGIPKFDTMPTEKDWLKICR